MPDSYKYKHRFEVDGKEAVAKLADSNYSASRSHPANQLVISAGATDSPINLTNKGSIKRILIKCLSPSPTQLTAKINGSSQALKVNPILMLTGAITSATLTNADTANSKTVEVVTVSE